MFNRPSLKKIVPFSLFTIFILLLNPLYADTPLSLQNKEVIVLFEKPLQPAAKEALEIYPVIKKSLEKTLGWRVNFRPTVILIKNSETFQRIAGTDLIVGFAVPRKNLIVIDYSKMNMHPFTIEVTLKHELCHLLLHNYIKKENLPRWLDEGIAQWMSDGIAEIIMDQKRSVLNEASLTGNYIRIRALTEGFPGDKRSLFLAYEESKSLVEYIINKFGIDAILTILEHLKDGEEVDAAILKVLTISLDELERGWHNHLKKRITWFTYLANNLNEILFFLAALIMIYGFIRHLIKKRAYKYEEEDNNLFL